MKLALLWLLVVKFATIRSLSLDNRHSPVVYFSRQVPIFKVNLNYDFNCVSEQLGPCVIEWRDQKGLSWLKGWDYPNRFLYWILAQVSLLGSIPDYIFMNKLFENNSHIIWLGWKNRAQSLYKFFFVIKFCNKSRFV